MFHTSGFLFYFPGSVGVGGLATFHTSFSWVGGGLTVFSEGAMAGATLIGVWGEGESGLVLVA